MAVFFEIVMLICFCVSWPVSIAKMLKTKSSEGKSIVFSALIFAGYVCGVIQKLILGNIVEPLEIIAFSMYFVNLAFIFIDSVLYYKYKKVGKK